MARSGYRGVGLQAVDDKGRVAIPAALRATLEKNSGAPEGSKEARVAVLTSHEKDPCLVAYDAPFFDSLMERLEARELEFADDRGGSDSNIWREGVGVSEDVAFDASGRFIVPGMHAEHAGIAKPGYAYFLGVGKQIEIWDPATLLAHPTMPEQIKKSCRYHCAEKKVAL